MQDQDSTVSSCPSFSVYSSDQLATIAAEVSETEQNNGSMQRNKSPGSLSDDDFEFVPVHANPDACQSFPLFNGDLLLDHRHWNRDESADDVVPWVEASLRKLFIEEDRDLHSSYSSSSSEAEEMEGAESGTYGAWMSKSSPSPARCEKSNSTGSVSKQRSWRLRDLLLRSRSDGKYSLTRLGDKPSNYGNSSYNKIDKEAELRKKEETSKAEKGKRTAPVAKEKAAAANEAMYGGTKASKGREKRKSYLPYRQDLFAFSVNVRGLCKTFPPF
uniref:Uncharacterized protein LOC8289796 isoform X1 n=1 Tax=Rhizophora mucronata TaxID=61149 RepID=A0A2P2JAW5_RHIMU